VTYRIYSREKCKKGHAVIPQTDLETAELGEHSNLEDSFSLHEGD
jgi:hypothetical protein